MPGPGIPASHTPAVLAEQVSVGSGVGPTRAQVPGQPFANSFLSLSFLTSNVEIRIVFPQGLLWRIQRKLLAQSWAHGKYLPEAQGSGRVEQGSAEFIISRLTVLGWARAEAPRTSLPVPCHIDVSPAP